MASPSKYYHQVDENQNQQKRNYCLHQVFYSKRKQQGHSKILQLREPGSRVQF